jgi:hypothetical protein
MSKGSKQRPTNKQKFNTNWDLIFSKPKVRKGEKAIPTVTHVDKKKEAKKRGLDE